MQSPISKNLSGLRLLLFILHMIHITINVIKRKFRNICHNSKDEVRFLDTILIWASSRISGSDVEDVGCVVGSEMIS